MRAFESISENGSFKKKSITRPAFIARDNDTSINISSTASSLPEVYWTPALPFQSTASNIPLGFTGIRRLEQAKCAVKEYATETAGLPCTRVI